MRTRMSRNNGREKILAFLAGFEPAGTGACFPSTPNKLRWRHDTRDTASELANLWFDWDGRETVLRRDRESRLAESPSSGYRRTRSSPPISWPCDPNRSRKWVPSSATTPRAASRSRRPARCWPSAPARTVGVEPFDATGRLGLLHMAYPLKMLLNARGHTDLVRYAAHGGRGDCVRRV